MEIGDLSSLTKQVCGAGLYGRGTDRNHHLLWSRLLLGIHQKAPEQLWDHGKQNPPIWRKKDETIWSQFPALCGGNQTLSITSITACLQSIMVRAAFFSGRGYFYFCNKGWHKKICSIKKKKILEGSGYQAGMQVYTSTGQHSESSCQDNTSDFEKTMKVLKWPT